MVVVGGELVSPPPYCFTSKFSTMRVLITVNKKDLVYTGVILVRTEGDNVILTLKDDYTVSDQSFSMENNISFVPYIHRFGDCSSISVIEEH